MIHINQNNGTPWHGDGMIRIGCDAYALFTTWRFTEEDEKKLIGDLPLRFRKLREEGVRYYAYEDDFSHLRPASRPMVRQIALDELCRRAAESFKIEHDITDDEFETDHWQTLFKIQYPEVA